MLRAELEAVLMRLAHGPLGEAPAAVGRISEEVERLLVGAAQPQALDPGDVALCMRADQGPAYALGDAAFAHPDGLAATIGRGIAGYPGEAVGTLGRSLLRKIAVFVPVTHLEALRDALSDAGAGQIGNYRDCTFSAVGTGSFLPLEGADPFIGEVGQRAYVDEARLETVFPAYREAAVLRAMRAAHPYEEIAFDLWDLRNPEPTYGATRLVAAQAMTAEELAQEVRLASGANDVEWCSPERAPTRIAQVLVACTQGEDLAGLGRAHGVDAVVAGRLHPTEEERLLQAAITVVRVTDLGLSGLRQFAARIENAALPVPVLLLPGGFHWRRPRG